jgi:hypothetical protein
MVTTWDGAAGCTSAAPCQSTDVAPDVIGSPFAAVAALVPDGAGGFRRYPGIFQADGSYAIPGVPAGTYLLELVEGSGLVRHVETSASTVDLGYDRLGRSDLAPATLATPVTFELSGLEPWGAGHEIQIASAGADLWDFPPVTGIALDQVSGTVVEDWRTPVVGQPLNLLDPADLLYVAQLPSYTATEGVEAYAYWRAATAAAVPGIAMTDGTPATIDALLAPVTRTSTLAVDWRVTRFEALLGGMGPAAVPATDRPPHELTVEAAPYFQLDPWPEGRGGTPESFRMVRGAATPDVVVTTPIVYGQYADETLWSEWRSATFAATVSYTAAGATTAYEARALVGRREPMLPAPPTPIVPAVGTVEAPLVAGSPALGVIPATGEAPLVSWSPPLAGTPTSTRVTLHRLGVGASGETTSTPVATWLVAGTSVQVPSGLLEPGREYYLEIAPQVRAGERFDVAPLRAPRAASHATTLTSPFSR